MNRVSVCILVATLCWSPLLAQKASSLPTRTDSISYALGVDLGRNLGNLDLELNSEMLYQGLLDAFNGDGSGTKLDEQQVRALIQAFQMEAREAQMAKMQAKAQEALAEGQIFLEENKQKSGITTTASGLQYEVLVEGSGAVPTASDKVEVHYSGKLLDETVFDSSYDRGEPIVFPVGGVIPGWIEALQLMPVGSKWRLYIPSNLAYGERGSPPNIGPNETLIFDVELLSIQ